jgi:hypothetical protein
MKCRTKFCSISTACITQVQLQLGRSLKFCCSHLSCNINSTSQSLAAAHSESSIAIISPALQQQIGTAALRGVHNDAFVLAALKLTFSCLGAS